MPLVRFGIVGTSNVTLGYAVFLLVLALPQPFPAKAAVAQFLCYLAGMVWSFFWNKYWTFGKQGDSRGQALRFFSLQMALMGISSLAVGILVEMWGWHASASWFVVQGAVIALNYVLSRYWAFR